MQEELQQEVKPVHPYAKTLQDNLTTQRKMETLLQQKVIYLLQIIEQNEKTKDFLSTNTSNEKLAAVDYEIQLIRTEGELNTLRKVIKEKDNYYQQYMKQFEIDIAEVNLKFKNTVAIARKSTKPNVIKLLSEIQWDRVDNDEEVKIAVYKQLRKHV